LIKEHIAYLDQEIEKIRQQIAELIEQNPKLKQKKSCWILFPESVR